MIAVETEEMPQLRKDVVPSKYRELYKGRGGTCGDFVATELQRVAKDGPVSLDSVKTENGIPALRWHALNIGLQRMNLANVLRARYLKGEVIRILGAEYDISVKFDEFELVDTDASLREFAEFCDLQSNDRTVAALRSHFFPKAKGQTEEQRAAKAAERLAAKQAKAAEKARKAAEKEAAKLAKAEAAAAAKAAKAAAKAE
jgi:hypothetical protein